MNYGKTLARFCVVTALAMLFTVGCRQTDSFYSNVLRSDVFYQVYEEHKFDFLWVIDNSGSMAPRRQVVRDNLQQFVNILGNKKAVDYQMAIVTTDMFSQSGDLVANASGLRVVKSETSKDPIADFASIINNVVDTPTSFWEQGLESAYQALYKHKDEFSRPGVPLIMIIMSDEDDYSCKDNCYGVEPEHNASWKPFSINRYVQYFQNVKKAENTDMFVFPIVITDADTCDFTSIGLRYMKVAEDVGGLSVSGSICDSKFYDSMLNVAKVIADRGSKFKLSTPSSGQGINVFVNQQLVPYSPDNYVYDQPTNSIIFTGAVPPKGAIVEVTYNQATN